MKRKVTFLIVAMAIVGCTRDRLSQAHKSTHQRRSIEDSLIFLMERDTLTGTDTIWLYGQPYTIIEDTN